MSIFVLTVSLSKMLQDLPFLLDLEMHLLFSFVDSVLLTISQQNLILLFLAGLQTYQFQTLMMELH